MLREINDEDHEWLVELHNDPVVLHNLTNNNPVTMEQHMVWWNFIKNSTSEKRMIYEIDKIKIGITKFYNIDKRNRNCVLGADIHKEHRGKRLARTMWNEMIEHCFQVLDLHRISLTTAEYNSHAIRLYEKLGFQVEGLLKQSLFRNGNFYDQICMYKVRPE